MVQIDIKMDDNGLANAFQRKGGELGTQLNNLTRDIVNIAQRWVQKEAPRKTGNLKAAVKKTTSGTSGIVWVSKAQANYCDFVIDGTRGHDIVAKNKRALRVPGYGIFKRVHHPGTRSNPFVDRAAESMMGEINSRVKVFEEWLGDI